MSTKYAIVWATGKELYTHSDSAETALYDEAEIQRENIPFWTSAPASWPVEQDGRVAVPVEALNILLGL